MASIKNKLIGRYILRDSIKDYKGYKVKPPEETIKIIESAFDKMGLDVLYTPKKDPLLKTFHSFQSGTATLHPKDDKKIILLQTGGKGVTPKLAQASGIAELIERFTGYGQAQGNISNYLSAMKLEKIWGEKRKRNKFIEKEFQFHSMGTSELILNEKNVKYSKMTESVCYSLTEKELVRYPEEFITKLVGSNGLASGNTFEEATLHGLFEVIERLGGMYVLDKLPECNKISKETITHPTLKKLMKAISSVGITFELIDFSQIFNIPLIVTIFDHPKWNFQKSKFYVGPYNFPKMLIGVDSDSQDAAIRCFTEFIQTAMDINSMICTEKETRERFELSKLSSPSNYINFLKTSAVRDIDGNQPNSIDYSVYLKKAKKIVSITDINSIYDQNQKVEINRFIKNLRELNIEVLVHNITNPILKFPVVRVILQGREGYSSQIPLNGYNRLVLGTNNSNERYYYLKKSILKILSSNMVHKIIEKEEWCYNVEEQKKMSEKIIEDLFFSGFKTQLWGMPLDKFYFLGMLYLGRKKYEQAKNCFNASLYNNFNNIPSLIGLLHILSNQDVKEERKYVRDHIDIINTNYLDVDYELKELEKSRIVPNPFEPCDFQCHRRNKPHLCKNCFFNYVSENNFMKTFLDCLFNE